MTTLTRRGPYANAPAKLPGIQTARIPDLNTRQAVESLREWVEVRLGARGDRFERAVTFREFDQTLNVINRTLASLQGTQGTVATSSSGGSSSTASTDIASLRAQVTTLQSEVTALREASTAADSAQDAALLDLGTRLALLIARVVLVEAAVESPVTRFLVSDTDGELTPTARNNAVYEVLVDDDVTVSSPAGAVSGQRYTYVFEQDGVGGHNITFDDSIKFSDGTSFTPSTIPQAITVLDGVYYERLTSAFFLVTGYATISTDVELDGYSFASATTIGVLAATSAATGSAVAAATSLARTNQGVAASAASAVVTGRTGRGVGSSTASATVLGVS